ncbi:hypothetical protein Scep_010294 [Stephania cephalantha]|uniref:Uncharacterized protein n=1 Tax=Stephania cephalantha TaxID=152367 RepID=A0AAP0JW28_9MAGN
MSDVLIIKIMVLDFLAIGMTSYVRCPFSSKDFFMIKCKLVKDFSMNNNV